MREIFTETEIVHRIDKAIYSFLQQRCSEKTANISARLIAIAH